MLKTKDKTNESKPEQPTRFYIYAADEMRGRKSIHKYSGYVNPIVERNIVELLNGYIADSEDGIIRISTAEFADAIGMKVTQQDYDGGKEAHSIYWGAKYALYVKGNLQVESGKSIRDDDMLIICHAPEIYQLPPSLKQHLTADEIYFVEVMKAADKAIADAKKAVEADLAETDAAEVGTDATTLEDAANQIATQGADQVGTEATVAKPKTKRSKAAKAADAKKAAESKHLTLSEKMAIRIGK